MVIAKIIPFMVIFFMWNIFFALELDIMKSNIEHVEDDIKGPPNWIGY